jgi:hypothetical protein
MNGQLGETKSSGDQIERQLMLSTAQLGCREFGWTDSFIWIRRYRRIEVVIPS